MAKVSVIVVNWNGRHFLETCLLALRRQVFRDFETIFVDNGSNDGSPEYVQAQFPEVKLVVLSQNRGFAAANIVGYENALGELIVLLNNDTEMHPHCLEELQNASGEYPKAGSFACKMLLFDDRRRIDICGFGMTIAGTTVDFGRGELDGPEWNQPRRVFGACAGAAAYRRGMLEDTGFFDADFFGTYEDGDLSFRAQLLGYDCVFVPNATVYHSLTGTMKKYPTRQVYLSQRNIEFLYWKNMPLGLLVRGLPQRFLYELGSAIYFTKKGAGMAYLTAKLDAIRQLPSIQQKRRAIQARRTVSNTQLRSMMEVNWLGARWKKLVAAWERPARTESQPHKSSSTGTAS